MKYKGLYKHLKKPAIYVGVMAGGAILGGAIGYEISHEVFNSVSQSSPSLVKIVEALSQSTQDAYYTLSGVLAGGVGGGLLGRKITK